MALTAVPALLSFGSNLGDRRLNLRRAVQGMAARMRVVRLSSLYETAPIDAPCGSRPFLNAAALVLHRGGAERLLEEIIALECQLGRVRCVRNGPRIIDVDLIAHDATVRASPLLTIPHPRYRDREFVLAPLREIAPWWVDPILQVRVETLRGVGEVRRMGQLLR